MGAETRIAVGQREKNMARHRTQAGSEKWEGTGSPPTNVSGENVCFPHIVDVGIIMGKSPKTAVRPS
ncbi:MAG: hypothetical protein LBU23_11600 [Planctomycetota bacterium]|nr:hypothetical protein [Planctomycetota bacterium]